MVNKSTGFWVGELEHIHGALATILTYISKVNNGQNYILGRRIDSNNQ